MGREAIVTKFDDINLPALRNELRRLWGAIDKLSAVSSEAVSEMVSSIATSKIGVGIVSVSGDGGSPAPANPIMNLIATGTLSYIVLSWTNPDTPAGDYIEIWRSETNDLAAASRVAMVSVFNDTYWDLIGVAEETRYYWIRVVTDGIAGSWIPTSSTGGVEATTGTGTEPTEVEDFSITASKLFLKIPILEVDSWTNNSPSAGYVAWNAHNLYYNGAKYEIIAGNTNLKYIYWLNGATSYSASDTNPTLGNSDFIIAVNIGGSYDLAWNAIANQVIGSAYIQDASIINAKIGNLAVDAAKIANLAVSEGKIGNLAVTEGKIANLAVTAAKIADLTVTGAKIANATITEGKIENLAVTAAKIANATITGAKIASATIGEANIGSLAVTNAKIGNLAVDTVKVAGDAITATKRQVVYNGSADLSAFSLSGVWRTMTIAHNLGRRVLVQMSVNGSFIVGDYESVYGLRSNDLNSFVMQVGFKWSGASGYTTVSWDYW